MPPKTTTPTKPNEISTTELIELERGYNDLRNLASEQLEKIHKILRNRLDNSLNK
tara:strand:+ start:354 stop:518 length:165 start_codon:yes stop_codon:yes gene_type:complete